VGRGILVALVGVGIGIVAALLLTGTLKVMLDDVKPTDPVVYVVNAALVLVVSTIASYLPARSAGRTDPMVVLRDG